MDLGLVVREKQFTTDKTVKTDIFCRGGFQTRPMFSHRPFYCSPRFQLWANAVTER